MSKLAPNYSAPDPAHFAARTALVVHIGSASATEYPADHSSDFCAPKDAFTRSNRRKMLQQHVRRGEMMDESEPLLVARATQRDREAFAQLYNLHFDRIYRFVRLKVNNQADAEDLTSRVFLNAWRSIDRFSPKHDSSFVAWLFRLAHNALIDSYRRGYEIVSLDASAAFQLDESSPPPEDDLEWRLTIMTLQQALNALTSDQREVVLLRFIGGLSAREVGDIMGKQEGTVRGIQFRALEALRRALRYAREGDILD